MNIRKRQIRPARKAKAQRLHRWNGVPTPSSHFATDGVTPAQSVFGLGYSEAERPEARSMSALFKIGEEALLVAQPKDILCGEEVLIARYLGQTITVVSRPMYVWFNRSPFYEVQAEDGRRFAATEKALQKIPPHNDSLTKVSWASCPWSPPRVVERA